MTIQAGDLASLDDVKAWLKTGLNEFPTTDDELLARLITAASSTIQNWCNRSFAVQDWLEIRDGLGSGYFLGPCQARFQFGAWPVTAVASVSIAGVAIPAAPILVQAGLQAGYTFTPTQLIITGYPVPRAAACVTMQYTAGYNPIPDDLQQACIEMVCLKYRERTRIGERSKSLGSGLTVTYQGPLFTRRDMIASDIQAAIEQYQAVAPSTTFLQPL